MQLQIFLHKIPPFPNNNNNNNTFLIMQPSHTDHHHNHNNNHNHHSQPHPKIFYKTQNNEWKPAKCDECIHEKLGARIDVQWDIKQGVMKMCRSNTNVPSSYERNQQQKIERIKGAHFCHAKICPFLNDQIVKNPEKFMKPCSCVMLYNKQKDEILITQRSPNLRTFPNSWVLPGGHLESGEGMFEGGVRQCEQQVGLPVGNNSCQPLKQDAIMIWQSCFTMDGHIKACAMVVFFVAFCKQFDVKIDPREVSDYRWKNINDRTGEVRYTHQTKTGYAEGHLKYLQIVRQFMKKQQEK